MSNEHVNATSPKFLARTHKSSVRCSLHEQVTLICHYVTLTAPLLDGNCGGFQGGFGGFGGFGGSGGDFGGFPMASSMGGSFGGGFGGMPMGFGGFNGFSMGFGGAGYSPYGGMGGGMGGGSGGYGGGYGEEEGETNDATS